MPRYDYYEDDDYVSPSEQRAAKKKASREEQEENSPTSARAEAQGGGVLMSFFLRHFWLAPGYCSGKLRLRESLSSAEWDIIDTETNGIVGWIDPDGTITKHKL